jgi:predicted Fe-Mo cluster-binding NifX family protein
MVKPLKYMEDTINSAKGENMKVCIPSVGKKGLDENVSPHFGRAPYYTIVDLENMSSDVVENSSDHFGGSGSPADLISGKKADVVLTHHIGGHGRESLLSKGVKVYCGQARTVKDFVEAFKAGRLIPASEENECARHRHGKEVNG